MLRTVSLVLVLLVVEPSSCVYSVNDVKQVHLLIRHGMRAPEVVVNNVNVDPYGDAIWPNGYGGITKEGTEQMYENGVFFRHRYKYFIDPANAERQAWVRSTDIPRVLASAEALAAGLFPPTDPYHVWSTKFNIAKYWRPIPVHTVAPDQETLINLGLPVYVFGVQAHFASCPVLEAYMRDFWKTPEAQYLYKKHRDVFAYVLNNTGQIAADQHDAWMYILADADCFFVFRHHGVALPAWVDDYTYNVLEILYNAFWRVESGANSHRIVAKLAGGNLMKFIQDRMRDAIKGTPQLGFEETKTFIYTGHGPSVGSVLAMLGVYDFNWDQEPLSVFNWGSSLVFELLVDNSVRILLKDQPECTLQCEPLVIAHVNCTSPCPFEQFVDVTRHLVPDNRDLECRDPAAIAQIQAMVV